MAIQANELRIGNWLQFDNHIYPPKYIQVTARFFSALAGGRNMDDVPLNEELNPYYKPIPLTEDILRRAGFWKRRDDTKTLLLTLSNHDDAYPTTLQIWLRKEDNYIQICRSVTAGWTIKHFESVHQLQNLYFALTGEELQISF